MICKGGKDVHRDSTQSGQISGGLAIIITILIEISSMNSSNQLDTADTGYDRKEQTNPHL